MANNAQIPAAIRLLEMQHRSRDENRERFRRDAGPLLDAHLFAVSAAASVLFRSSEVAITHADPSVDHRLSLIALFMLSIDLCEVSIAEGLYSQAGTLLRQEVEILEAIHQHEKGDRRTTAPKLIKMRKIGRQYGELSAMAHVCRDDINTTMVRAEDNGRVGPSATPIYDEATARSLYALQIILVLHLIEQINTVNGITGAPSVDAAEMSMIRASLKILVECGKVKPMN